MYIFDKQTSDKPKASLVRRKDKKEILFTVLICFIIVSEGKEKLSVISLTVKSSCK